MRQFNQFIYNKVGAGSMTAQSNRFGETLLNLSGAMIMVTPVTRVYILVNHDTYAIELEGTIEATADAGKYIVLETGERILVNKIIFIGVIDD